MAKKKNKRSKPHNHNVLLEMTRLAAESRMAYSTSWTIANSMAAWAVMKTEGFKQERLSKLMQDMDAYEERYWNGEITFEELTNRVKEKAKWEQFTYVEYKESDITFRPGSYDYFLDKIQLKPQNDINRQYVVSSACLYNVLIDYGFGEKRLNRVEDKMDSVMVQYREEREIIHRIRKELADEGGIYMEDPKDPLNNNYLRSVML